MGIYRKNLHKNYRGTISQINMQGSSCCAESYLLILFPLGLESQEKFSIVEKKFSVTRRVPCVKLIDKSLYVVQIEVCSHPVLCYQCEVIM